MDRTAELTQQKYWRTSRTGSMISPIADVISDVTLSPSANQSTLGSQLVSPRVTPHFGLPTNDVTSRFTAQFPVPVYRTSVPFSPCLRHYDVTTDVQLACDVTACGRLVSRDVSLIGLPVGVAIPLTFGTLPVVPRTLPRIVPRLLLQRVTHNSTMFTNTSRQSGDPSLPHTATDNVVSRSGDEPLTRRTCQQLNVCNVDQRSLGDNHVTSSDAIEDRQLDDVTTTSRTTSRGGHVTHGADTSRTISEHSDITSRWVESNNERYLAERVEHRHQLVEQQHRDTLFRPYLDTPTISVSRHTCLDTPASTCSTRNSATNHRSRRSIDSHVTVTSYKQPVTSQTRKYSCDVCGRHFSRSNTLVTHRRIHTGDKPFSCELCGRAFRQPGNLTRHRITHTSFRPFTCHVCSKSFNRASNLHTHQRVHMSLK